MADVVTAVAWAGVAAAKVMAALAMVVARALAGWAWGGPGLVGTVMGLAAVMVVERVRVGLGTAVAMVGARAGWAMADPAAAATAGAAAAAAGMG